MRSPRAASGALGAFLALAIAVVASAANPDSISQQTIGGARLGLDRASYRAVLGPATVVTAFPGGTTRIAYRGGEIQVFLREGVGTAILTASDKLRMKDGVGPCVSAKRLTAAFRGRALPYRTGRAHSIVAYRVGHLVFAVPGGRVSAVLLTDNAQRDLPLVLTAAGCGSGDED